MRNIFIFCFILFTTSTGESLYSQGFKPPSEGNAVVYFVRPKGYSDRFEFRFFHNDRFIGQMEGDNYLRYECTQGEHLFWTASENHKYLEADLVSGDTYIVKVFVTPGGLQMRVFWKPVLFSEKDRFEEAFKLISKQEPFTPPEEDLVKMNKKLEKMIQENLDRYGSRKDEQGSIETLTPEMAIPKDGIKY